MPCLCLCMHTVVWSLPCAVTTENFLLAVVEVAIPQGKGLADVVFSSAQLNLDKE